eukprot:m51a1_g557 hypothetical protein (477) ;mRNA; r:481928-483568
MPAGSTLASLGGLDFLRHGVSSLLQNGCTYYYWILVPLAADDLHASSLELGLIGGISSLVYAAVAIVCGALSVDRLPPAATLRAAVVLFNAGVLLTSRASAVWMFYGVVVASAVGNGVYWVVIQTEVGRLGDPKAIDARISLFSVFWSFGKVLQGSVPAVGFVLGGVLKKALGLTWSYYCMMMLDATQLLILPFCPCSRVPAAPAAGADVEMRSSSGYTTVNDNDDNDAAVGGERKAADPDDSPEARRTAALNSLFLYLSWVMNFCVYGTMATLCNQYVKLAKYWDVKFPSSSPEVFLGVFLGSIYVAQTVVFLTGSALAARLHHRRSLLYATEGTLAVVSLGLSLLRNCWALVGLAALSGVCAGISYLCSLVYSLTAPKKKSCFVGLHETILASGNTLMPLLAGGVAKATGNLKSPYWLCCATLVGAVIVQEVLFRVYWAVYDRKAHIEEAPLVVAQAQEVQEALPKDSPCAAEH